MPAEGKDPVEEWSVRLDFDSVEGQGPFGNFDVINRDPFIAAVVDERESGNDGSGSLLFQIGPLPSLIVEKNSLASDFMTRPTLGLRPRSPVSGSSTTT